MRKALIIGSLVSLLIIISVACQRQAMKAMPATEGSAFWSYISQTDPYTEWEHWPGRPDIYPGQSPHGAYLRLYANPIAIEAAKAGKTTMPYGAIIVKENYGPDKTTLMAITPMYRVEGYNPDGGDWFWAKYGPDGSVMGAGKVEGCINCHRTVMDNGWLFTKAQ